MYDLPDQTEESWRYTLDQLTDLSPSTISLSTTSPSSPTPLPQAATPNPRQRPLPSASFTAALEKLESIGLHRYEISAFAHPDHESRHNLGYWTARPFLGFGPSAFSYWEGERFRNIANLHRYAHLQSNTLSRRFSRTAPLPANIKELLAIRLRLIQGADLAAFPLPPETTATIAKLIAQGLLIQEGTQLRLTDRGTLFYDTVATEII